MTATKRMALKFGITITLLNLAGCAVAPQPAPERQELALGVRPARTADAGYEAWLDDKPLTTVTGDLRDQIAEEKYLQKFIESIDVNLGGTDLALIRRHAPGMVEVVKESREQQLELAFEHRTILAAMYYDEKFKLESFDANQRLDDAKAKVGAAQAKLNALKRVPAAGKPAKVYYFGDVAQVHGEHDLLVLLRDDGGVVWVTNVTDTGGLVEGSRYRGALDWDGDRRQYQSAFGTKTVKLMRDVTYEK